MLKYHKAVHRDSSEVWGKISIRKCQFTGTETFHRNVLVLMKRPLGELSKLKCRNFVKRRIQDLLEYWRITKSQNHRITEWWELEGTSVGLVVQPICQSRVTYSRLHRTLSRWVLNISREGDSTTSLGSLFQCSVTLIFELEK